MHSGCDWDVVFVPFALMGGLSWVGDRTQPLCAGCSPDRVMQNQWPPVRAGPRPGCPIHASIPPEPMSTGFHAIRVIRIIHDIHSIRGVPSMPSIPFHTTIPAIHHPCNPYHPWYRAVHAIHVWAIRGMPSIPIHTTPAARPTMSSRRHDPVGSVCGKIDNWITHTVPSPIPPYKPSAGHGEGLVRGSNRLCASQPTYPQKTNAMSKCTRKNNPSMLYTS